MRNTGEEAKRRFKNSLKTGVDPGGISDMPLGKNMAPFDAPRNPKDTYRSIGCSVLKVWLRRKLGVLWFEGSILFGGGLRGKHKGATAIFRASLFWHKPHVLRFKPCSVTWSPQCGPKGPIGGKTWANPKKSQPNSHPGVCSWLSSVAPPKKTNQSK